LGSPPEAAVAALAPSSSPSTSQTSPRPPTASSSPWPGARPTRRPSVQHGFPTRVFLGEVPRTSPLVTTTTQWYSLISAWLTVAVDHRPAGPATLAHDRPLRRTAGPRLMSPCPSAGSGRSRVWTIWQECAAAYMGLWACRGWRHGAELPTPWCPPSP